MFSAFSALSYGDSVNEEAVKWPERTQINGRSQSKILVSEQLSLRIKSLQCEDAQIFLVNARD